MNQKWTPGEIGVIDNYIQAMQRQGDKISWVYISRVIRTKTPHQCYDFYKSRYSGGNIIQQRKAWTDDQRVHLLTAYHQYNHNWMLIQQEFPGYSLSQLKNKIKHLKQLKVDCQEIQLIVFDGILD